MVPTWVLIATIIPSMWAGAGLMAFLLKRRKSTEVDRTEKEEERPLNFFDAYSDEDLKKQRSQTADTIRDNRRYGYNPVDKIKYLRQVDNEIASRNNAKLALEETRRTQHERDIAIFDTIYGEVLKNAGGNK